MNPIMQRHGVRFAIALYAVLLLPPVKQLLDATMTAQMLLQIPLLIVAGYLLRDAVPQRARLEIAKWNHRGISGLVLASVATMVWMLPRLLDAATSEPLVAAAKYISVPLLIGLPLGLSWPHMGFVIKGFLMLEVIATFFRLGWLYLISPVRLCSNFLLEDQQRLGEYMLVIGAAILAAVAGRLVWGNIGESRN
ncbi:MAG: hypothetical protein IT521_04590 [Burkholderiales bacterium]|nr:hypothetical protein [Burkholderiales bacterium]